MKGRQYCKFSDVFFTEHSIIPNLRSSPDFLAFMLILQVVYCPVTQPVNLSLVVLVPAASQTESESEVSGSDFRLVRRSPGQR